MVDGEGRIGGANAPLGPVAGWLRIGPNPLPEPLLTEEMCRDIGADEERARIVTWLRETKQPTRLMLERWRDNDCAYSMFEGIADAIERGDHNTTHKPDTNTDDAT